MTFLYSDLLDRWGLNINSWGHWHQRFESALSWDMVTWRNISRQKFRNHQIGSIQDTFQTSLPEYMGNRKNLYVFSMVCMYVWIISRRFSFQIKAHHLYNYKRLVAYACIDAGLWFEKKTFDKCTYILDIIARSIWNFYWILLL